MSALTVRQRDLLFAFARYLATHGVAPSHRELAALHGVKAVSGISRHITALVEGGFLEYVGPRVAPRSRRPRSMRLTPYGQQALGVAPVEVETPAMAPSRVVPKLRAARLALKLSPEEVAARVSEQLASALQLTAFHAYEAGRVPPPVDVLEAWAQAVEMVLVQDVWPRA